MNRKQLICMWFGIAAIVWVGLLTTPLVSAYGDVDWDGFLLWTILISLVTSGLIITFKDKAKKPKDE